MKMGRLEINWVSFLIAGMFITVLGIALLSIQGLGYLAVGALVSGFFLNLAAVLQALADRSRSE